MLRKPGYLDIPDLDIYYRDCVIGGQGAFMVPVREREQFVERDQDQDPAGGRGARAAGGR